MKAALLSFVIMLIIACAPAPELPQEPAPEPAVMEPAAPEPPAPEPAVEVPEQPQGCVSQLEPQQMTDIKVSVFEDSITETDDGFTFRVLPVTSDGEIIPLEGTITVSIYSSEEDNPLKKEYPVYTKSFYRKKEDVLADCGPVPVEVTWKAIQASKNYRYLKLPNPGIMHVEFTRTGSGDLFEKEYKGAEHEVNLVR